VKDVCESKTRKQESKKARKLDIRWPNVIVYVQCDNSDDRPLVSRVDMLLRA
jgi:hypothetical protein